MIRLPSRRRRLAVGHAFAFENCRLALMFVESVIIGAAAAVEKKPSRCEPVHRQPLLSPWQHGAVA